MRKSRAFTLLELVMVIGIIALSFSVVGVSIQRLVRKDQFESDVSRLCQTIELAEVMMCTQKEDVLLTCSSTPKGVCMHLHSPSVDQKTYLKHIKAIRYQDQEGCCKLHFLARLSQPPQGEIELGGLSHRKYVRLPGYPAGLTVHTKPHVTGVYHASSQEKEMLPVA